MTTPWRSDLLGVLEHWARRLPPETRGFRTLATAERTAEPGWYRAELGDDLDPASLEDIRLVAPGATSGHRVLQLEADGGVLHLRVSAHVDDEALELHATEVAVARQVGALRAALESMPDPSLADDLVEGRTARDVRAAAMPGLDPAQQVAYAACRAPGLHLVWGPPGTGRTRVLARAAHDLLADGRRVLLVSPTGVAVDDALLGLIGHAPPGRGAAVRVGLPLRPAIARDADVALDRLVSRHAAKLAGQRTELEQELVRLTAPARELATITRQLAGFDEAGYHQAVELEQHERRREAAVEEFAATWYAAREADAEHERTEADLRVSQQRRDELRPAANLLAEAATLEAEIAGLAADHEGHRQRWQAALDRLTAHDEQAADLATAGRWWRPRTRAVANAHQQRNTRLRADVEEARVALDRAADHLAAETTTLTDRISRLRGYAAPVDDEQVRAVEQDFEQASARSLQTGERRAEAAGAAEQAAGELKEAEALPRLIEAQRAALADARAGGIPALLARRRELITKLDGARRRIREREQRQERLGAEYDRVRANVESRIVADARLVATTTAEAYAHPAVLDGAFDVVLVDDAGEAPVPYLLPLLARAARTAVLVGDVVQGGPPLPPKLNPHRPDVKAWLGRDAFAFCGVASAKQARQRCVVLHRQYRLPPLVTELANRIAYGGTLVPARDTPDGDAQVVFVDTDGAGNLTTPAVAVAERHRDRGETVEVVALHPERADAARTLSQGRSVDVVVLDLGVEPGRDWSREAARLCALAITRPRRKLYVVGSGESLRAARPGTAAHAVASMLTDGGIERLPAAALLDEGSAGPPEPVTELGERAAQP